MRTRNSKDNSFAIANQLPNVSLTYDRVTKSYILAANASI